MKPIFRGLAIIIAAPMLFVVLWFLTRANAQNVIPAGLVRWEYKMLRTAFQEPQFNMLGKDGWELVAVTTENPDNATTYAVFKRPLELPVRN